MILALALCAAWALGCQASENNRAWLGVEICDNSNQTSLKSATPGVLVLKVEEGSPAFVAGIRLRDIIVGLDEQPVASAEYFICVIATRKPGSIARLAVVRGSERQVTFVALGHWPDDLRLIPSHCVLNVG